MAVFNAATMITRFRRETPVTTYDAETIDKITAVFDLLHGQELMAMDWFRIVYLPPLNSMMIMYNEYVDEDDGGGDLG